MEQLAMIRTDTSGQRPSDFFENPNGRLGAHMLCNPFLEPFKMMNLISRRHKPENLRIIGYPDINWQGSASEDGPLKDYLFFSEGYSAHVVDWSSKISCFCKGPEPERRPRGGRRRRGNDGASHGTSDDGTVEEQPTDDHNVPIIPGWPKSKSGGFFNRWLLSTCPILLEFRSLEQLNMLQQYPCFTVNFGEIPPHTMCLLRGFMFHDEENADAEKLNAINLRGMDIPGDLSAIMQFYYNKSSAESGQLATSGCRVSQYNNIVEFIQKGISDGYMTPMCGVRMMMKHLRMSLSVLHAMIDGGSFVSDKMTQALQITKLLFKPNDSGRTDLFDALNEYQARIRPTLPSECAHIPFDATRHMLLRALCDVNNGGQLLNSINLMNKLTLKISALAFYIGKINDPLVPIGKTTEIAPCSGSAREYAPSGILVTKTDNPNGAGKDFVGLKYNQDQKELADKLKIKSKFCIEVIPNFTPTSVQLACCIQEKGHKIVSTPDVNETGKLKALTELRGGPDDLKKFLNALIVFIVPRGGEVDTVSSTTRENKGSGLREEIYRRQFCDYPLVYLCSNMNTSNITEEEQKRTLHAVIHLTPPGATPMVQDDQTGSYHKISRNRYEGRSYPLDAEMSRVAAYTLAATEIMASMLGTLNYCGFYKIAVNAGTLPALQWMLFYVRKYYSSIFHEDSARVRRLENVYETRTSVLTMWVKTTQYLKDHQDYETAMSKAAASFQCDAIPLTSCGDLLYTMICRCLSWTPVLISRCFMNECSVPIVPLEILVDLLTMPNPPRQNGSALRDWYDRICVWLRDCMSHGRFCPNPAGGGLCEYISSNGNAFGGVDADGIFRVARSQNGWTEPIEKHVVQGWLAKSIWIKNGVELAHTCALSEKSLIPALNDMLNGKFCLDFGKLLGTDGVNLTLMDRHMQFFCMADQGGFVFHSNLGRNPFAIPSVWMKVICVLSPKLFNLAFYLTFKLFQSAQLTQPFLQDQKDAASVGVGVHWVQLLLLGSLIGNSIGRMLHPQIIFDLAANMVREILLKAPRAATPTRRVEIQRFNPFTCELEPIDLQTAKPRPDHYLRVQSEQFARDGCLIECMNFDSFAAEDILPVGSVAAWAKIMKCKVWEVPASAEISYYLEEGKYYCIYNRVTGCLGTIRIHNNRVAFHREVARGTDERDESQIPIDAWQSRLSRDGFIVLPAIRRLGACVSVDGGHRIGCLVPPSEEDSACGNMSCTDFTYRAKTMVDTVIYVPVMDVMENLLPIGKRLYLLMESQSAARLLRRLTFPLPESSLGRHVLRVHLNSPDVVEPIIGKVYVAMLSMDGDLACSETIPVDPWEIWLDKRGRNEILHVNALRQAL